MKKIKCIKCGLYFKDRKDPEDKGLVHATLCWNCRFIWQCIEMTLKSLNFNPLRNQPLNRDIMIALKDVHIKIKKPPLEIK